MVRADLPSEKNKQVLFSVRDFLFFLGFMVFQVGEVAWLDSGSLHLAPNPAGVAVGVGLLLGLFDAAHHETGGKREGPTHYRTPPLRGGLGLSLSLGPGTETTLGSPEPTLVALQPNFVAETRGVVRSLHHYGPEGEGLTYHGTGVVGPAFRVGDWRLRRL